MNLDFSLCACYTEGSKKKSDTDKKIVSGFSYGMRYSLNRITIMPKGKVKCKWIKLYWNKKRRCSIRG